jgi:hypothetical protein
MCSLCTDESRLLCFRKYYLVVLCSSLQYFSTIWKICSGSASPVVSFLLLVVPAVNSTCWKSNQQFRKKLFLVHISTICILMKPNFKSMRPVYPCFLEYSCFVNKEKSMSPFYAVTCAELSPDGEFIAVGTKESFVRVLRYR